MGCKGVSLLENKQIFHLSKSSLASLVKAMFHLIDFGASAWLRGESSAFHAD